MKFFEEFKTAQNFMSEIATGFNRPNRAFLLVSHINPTSLPLIKSLSKAGRLAGIIAKPNSIDFRSYDILSDIYPFIKLTKQDFYQPGIIQNSIVPLIKPRENLTIIDIGGYFAPALRELNRLPSLTGIVEDTENGLQKYEKALADFPQNKVPLFSVARSRCKEFEDYLIGRSIALSAIKIIKKYRKFSSASVGIIGFGEVGRGAAFFLKERLSIQPCIYDCSEKARRLAALSGFQNAEREDLIRQSDIIICATGHGSLQDQDIPKLKTGAYIASCTSADDEFAFKKFQIIPDGPSLPHIDTCQGIHFLNRGNAVNFLNPAEMEKILSPYIYLTHSALLQSAVKLDNLQNMSGEKINELLPKEEAKLIQNFRGQIKTVNANRTFINKFMQTKLFERF